MLRGHRAGLHRLNRHNSFYESFFQWPVGWVETRDDLSSPSGPKEGRVGLLSLRMVETTHNYIADSFILTILNTITPLGSKARRCPSIKALGELRRHLRNDALLILFVRRYCLKKKYSRELGKKRNVNRLRIAWD